MQQARRRFAYVSSNFPESFRIFRAPIGYAVSRKSATAIVCLWLALAMAGCGFRTLRRDLEQTASIAGIEGRVSARGVGEDPLAVVVYAAPAGPVIDLYLLPRAGSYYFALPAGSYVLAAFVDRNRDLSYQPDSEPAALYDGGRPLVLAEGERKPGFDLTIDQGSSSRIPIAISGLTPGRREIEMLPDFQLGTVTGIDDARFSHDNGKLGLWNPLAFLFDVGAGVYFLEEYDPQKIPVLFVHGAIGSPADFEFLLGRLDRSRFQPWLVYYPSAPRLGRLGSAIARAVAALQVRYRFEQMAIIGYSMGGLVSRAAINSMMSADSQRFVELPAFLTISTPWGGHPAAAAGVEQSPVVAPAWEDLAPGSDFLANLSRTRLPAECEYTLLFSYGGTSSFGSRANDGAVPVASELALSIQRQAVRVRGFDETHTGILRSPEVAAEVNGALHRAFRKAQPEMAPS